MGYAVTDAVESEMELESKALTQLCEDSDQLAGLAADCDTVAPISRKLALALAYYSEMEYRELHGSGTCGHADTKDAKCGTCSFLRSEQYKYILRTIDLR